MNRDSDGATLPSVEDLIRRTDSICYDFSKGSLVSDTDDLLRGCLTALTAIALILNDRLPEISNDDSNREHHGSGSSVRTEDGRDAEEASRSA